MSAEQLFSLCGLVALAGWILLIAAPRNVRALTTAGTVIPGVLSCLYLFLLAGWVHYLAFDLFVGTWETRDAVARGISRWILAPCLLLTFLFGPIGWLAYHVARNTRHRGESASDRIQILI